MLREFCLTDGRTASSRDTLSISNCIPVVVVYRLISAQVTLRGQKEPYLLFMLAPRNILKRGRRRRIGRLSFNERIGREGRKGREENLKDNSWMEWWMHSLAAAVPTDDANETDCSRSDDSA